MEYLHSIRKQFKEEVIVYFQTHVCIIVVSFLIHAHCKMEQQQDEKLIHDFIFLLSF